MHGPPLRHLKNGNILKQSANPKGGGGVVVVVFSAGFHAAKTSLGICTKGSRTFSVIEQNRTLFYVALHLAKSYFTGSPQINITLQNKRKIKFSQHSKNFKNLKISKQSNYLCISTCIITN